MPTVYPLQRGQIIEGDGNNSRVTDTYRVTGIPTADIPEDGSLTGLPGIGDSYSAAQPGLRVTNIRRAADAGGFQSSEVSVTYSTNGFGKLPLQPQIIPAGGYLTGLNYQTLQVPIPIAVKRKVVVAGGGAEVEKEFWVVEEVTLATRLPVLTITVELSSLTLTQINAIEAQADTIHTINGKRYLFQPSPIAASTGPWRVTYSWVRDLGTPVLPFAGTTPGVAVPGSGMTIDPAPAAGLCRDPYHSLFVKPSDDPETTPPTVLQRRNYAEEPTGWQTLPGVPSL